MNRNYAAVNAWYTEGGRLFLLRDRYSRTIGSVYRRSLGAPWRASVYDGGRIVHTKYFTDFPSAASFVECALVESALERMACI